MPANRNPMAHSSQQGQAINKQQLQELVKGLTALSATSEQKLHGLELMVIDLTVEPVRLRFEELFGERFTNGLRNWLDATRATEELAYQGVLSQLTQYTEILKHLESGIVLPSGFSVKAGQ